MFIFFIGSWQSLYPNWMGAMAGSAPGSATGGIKKSNATQEKARRFKARKCEVVQPMGPSIKYVTLFLANFDPSPCHTLSHIPGPPRKYVTHLGTPRFLV